jgi:hypothetical protein
MDTWVSLLAHEDCNGRKTMRNHGGVPNALIGDFIGYWSLILGSVIADP